MGVIMIVAILFMPQGILGVIHKIAEKVKAKKEAEK